MNILPTVARPPAAHRSTPRHSLLATAAALLALLMTAVFLQPAQASTITISGDIGSHDPSRMIKDGNTYYVYSTGYDIPMKYSTDKIHWKNGPNVLTGTIPKSVWNAAPSNDGHDVWAPDVIYVNGQYRLYYAVSGGKQCAIGLLTSPTLNPSASNYKWTDRGVVVSNTSTDRFSAIDPAPVTDAQGNQWLSWGSGYVFTWSDPEIFLTRLDNSTGLRSSTDRTNHPLVLGHVEASYVRYHAGYYYLFWNTGGCCSGTASTYTIHVARSSSITGPYVDKSGKQNSSATFFASTGNIHGPGQIGMLSENGTDYYTYHYYPGNGSVLGLGVLTWGADGWPVH